MLSWRLRLQEIETQQTHDVSRAPQDSVNCRLHPPPPSFFLISTPSFPSGSFLSLSFPAIALLFCCQFFSHSYHSVSPSLPWRSPSIFTATLEATCRVLVGVSPSESTPCRDTRDPAPGHPHWPGPFWICISFCPPRAERSPHSFGGRSALCSVCDPVYHPLSPGLPPPARRSWCPPVSHFILLHRPASSISSSALPSPPPSFRLSCPHIRGECLLHNFF